MPDGLRKEGCWAGDGRVVRRTSVQEEASDEGIEVSWIKGPGGKRVAQVEGIAGTKILWGLEVRHNWNSGS